MSDSSVGMLVMQGTSLIFSPIIFEIVTVTGSSMEEDNVIEKCPVEGLGVMASLVIAVVTVFMLSADITVRAK